MPWLKDEGYPPTGQSKIASSRRDPTKPNPRIPSSDALVPSNARSYVRFAFRFPPFRSPLTVHVGFTGRRTWILVGLHPSEPHPDRPRRLEQIRRRRGVRSQASESRISFFTFSTRTAPRSARHDVSLIGDPLKRGDFCEVGLGSGRFLERSPLDVVDVVWCCWFCMGTCFAFW